MKATGIISDNAILLKPLEDAFEVADAFSQRPYRCNDFAIVTSWCLDRHLSLCLQARYIQLLFDSITSRLQTQRTTNLKLKPNLLLLDEPSSGLNPEETEDLSFWIEDINEELCITIIMVEHDMNLVSIASDRVMALADGQLITIGSPNEVQSHPEVLRAYLGD